MASKKFPDRVFVVREEPANDKPYLVVFDSLEDAVEAAGDGGDVAVYDRDVVRTASIKLSLA